jgi:threonine/homoserine/homoserine lactone efflux protein
MTVSGLLVFATSYALAVASPGPGVAAAVARGLGHGRRHAGAFVAGFLAGDLIWFSVAAMGLAALAQALGPVFAVIRYAGAAYLLWLAWKLVTVPVMAPGEDDPAQGRPGGAWSVFLGSLSLTLGNPKAILFFMALLPSLLDLQALTLPSFLEVAGIMAVLLPSIIGGYVLLAARARRLFRSPRALRLLNCGTGAVMAGAAAVIATR